MNIHTISRGIFKLFLFFCAGLFMLFAYVYTEATKPSFDPKIMAKIEEQKALVSLTNLHTSHGTWEEDYTDNSPPMISDLSFDLTNNSNVDIYNIAVDCTSKHRRSFPDKDYPDKFLDFHFFTKAFAFGVKAGESVHISYGGLASIEDDLSDPPVGDDGTVVCKPTFQVALPEAFKTNGGTYGRLSVVDYTFDYRTPKKPLDYNGKIYRVPVDFTIKNNGARKLTEFQVTCFSQDRNETLLREIEPEMKKIAVDVAAKATGHYGAYVDVTMRNTPYLVYCRPTQAY